MAGGHRRAYRLPARVPFITVIIRKFTGVVLRPARDAAHCFPAFSTSGEPDET
jgi:hypothetical protein